MPNTKYIFKIKWIMYCLAMDFKWNFRMYHIRYLVFLSFFLLLCLFFILLSICVSITVTFFISLSPLDLMAWKTGVYIWCINSRIDWVAKYLLKTSWNSKHMICIPEEHFRHIPQTKQILFTLAIYKQFAFTLHSLNIFSTHMINSIHIVRLFVRVVVEYSDVFVTSSLFAV